MTPRERQNSHQNISILLQSDNLATKCWKTYPENVLLAKCLAIVFLFADLPFISRCKPGSFLFCKEINKGKDGCEESLKNQFKLRFSIKLGKSINMLPGYSVTFFQYLFPNSALISAQRYRWGCQDFCMPPYATELGFKPQSHHQSCTRLGPLKDALPTELQRHSIQCYKQLKSLLDAVQELRRKKYYSEYLHASNHLVG